MTPQSIYRLRTEGQKDRRTASITVYPRRSLRSLGGYNKKHRQDRQTKAKNDCFRKSIPNINNTINKERFSRISIEVDFMYSFKPLFLVQGHC